MAQFHGDGAVSGIDLVDDAVRNQGTAFTEAERQLAAIGLAVDATRPKRITDRMFIAAARASADQVSRDDRERGMLYPMQAGEEA